MKRGIERHLSYFDVKETLAGAASCAFCDIETKSLERYFDSLLYELANDPQVRADLLRSRGYCNRHTRFLLNSRKALSTAVLYRNNVQAFIEYLDGLLSHASCRIPRKGKEEWIIHRACPACRVQRDVQDRNISVFIEALDDPDMRAALDSSVGFCLPHFFAVMEKAQKPGARAIICCMQREKATRLASELDDFIRKQDYRFSHEPIGTEGCSWIQSVRMIAGENGLF